MLTIRLYGNYQLAGDSGPISLPTHAADAVLAYLAVHRGARISREVMAKAIWPEKSSEAGRTNLRTTLYRIRSCMTDCEPIFAERTTLALDTIQVRSDFDFADELHRTFLLAPDEAQGIAAGTEEWRIRTREILDNWDDEWIDKERRRQRLLTNDLGCDLAKALEDFGDAPGALQIWREILLRVPQHDEALRHAIRLEGEIHGSLGAVELAQQAARQFSKSSQIEMPSELKRRLMSVKLGAQEGGPQPVHIRKRSELFLLAKMFESNLASNAQEAMALLARECDDARNHAQPKAFLGLLAIALEHSSGTSSDRMRVAVQVGHLSSYCSRFDIGHKWTQFVIENTEESDYSHPRALTMKGLLYLEQRNYAGAREYLVRAVENAERNGFDWFRLAAISNLAMLQWTEMEFEKAIGSFQTILEEASRLEEPRRIHASTATYSCLAYLYAMKQSWSEAIEYSRRSQKMTDSYPLFGQIVSAPLGLALFADGKHSEGLREMMRGVNFSAREGMLRFNQMALDFAGIALMKVRRKHPALSLFEANGEQRFAISHYRSPAELSLIINATGMDPDEIRLDENPLRGQSAATLSAWTCEELERTLESAPV